MSLTMCSGWSTQRLRGFVRRQGEKCGRVLRLCESGSGNENLARKEDVHANEYASMDALSESSDES